MSCDFLYVRLGLAKSPYRPGVGTRPPYLAGRDEQLQRFHRILEDYPEKRNNLRVTVLRGVGKTVLLKEFERISRHQGWAVVRRDLSPRLCTESDFALAMSDYLRDGVEQLAVVAKIKNCVADAAQKAIGQVAVDLGDGVSVTLSGGGRQRESALEDRLRLALFEVGRLARAGAWHSCWMRLTPCSTPREKRSTRWARSCRRLSPRKTMTTSRCR